MAFLPYFDDPSVQSVGQVSSPVFPYFCWNSGWYFSMIIIRIGIDVAHARVNVQNAPANMWCCCCCLPRPGPSSSQSRFPLSR